MVLVSPADSYLSLKDRNPTAFHNQMLCGYLFPALVLWTGEPSLGFRPHTYQGEPFPAAEIPLQDLSYCLWKQHQPLLHFHPSYQSQCGFFCKSLVIRLLL